MSLPLSEAQTKKAVKWLKVNFGEQITEATKGTAWDIDLIAAICCKETAYKWLLWIDKYDADTILARCVFDTSGEPEFPQSPRFAFPKNREAFKAHYGQDFLDMLVHESNLQRNMPQAGYPKGWGPAPYLAKGYGIFQMDLQNIVTDLDFFKNKLWYNFSDCINACVKELNEKAKVKKNLQAIVTAYNGSGAKAAIYGEDVMAFREISKTV